MKELNRENLFFHKLHPGKSPYIAAFGLPAGLSSLTPFAVSVYNEV